MSGLDRNNKIRIVAFGVAPVKNFEFYLEVLKKWDKYLDTSQNSILKSWLNRSGHIQGMQNQMLLNALQFNCARHIHINCKATSTGTYDINDV